MSDVPQTRFQSFEELSDPSRVAPRIAALRKAMKAKNLDGYLVPRADAHQPAAGAAPVVALADGEPARPPAPAGGQRGRRIANVPHGRLSPASHDSDRCVACLYPYDAANRQATP